MKKLQLSIQQRLALYYAGILLAILLVFSIAVYLFTWIWHAQLEHKRLIDGYRMVESVVVNSGGDIFDVYHLSNELAFRVAFLNQHPPEMPDEYTTEAWEQAQLSLELAHHHDFDGFTYLTAKNGIRWWVRRGFVPESGMSVEYAQKMPAANPALTALALVLLALVPLSIIIAIPAGQAMARHALKPIDDLATKARSITAESLSERLPVANPNDELGQLAVVFNRLLGRLEDSFTKLKDFTADAAHELRTPLSSIRSLGEVALKTGTADHRCCEAIGEILEESNYITRILDNLLTLARGDTGNVKLNPIQFDLLEFAMEVENDLRVLAEDKRQKISLSASEPATAYGDQSSLRQALTNVLHNAIRYAPDNSQIELLVLNTDDDHAVLEVRDNGPGIPLDERERVFDRFYRLDKARTRGDSTTAATGVGLGLAIAKWAVETNGGTIRFVDRAGWNCCCAIRVPRKPPPSVNNKTLMQSQLPSTR